jgi:hypothetical protein
LAEKQNLRLLMVVIDQTNDWLTRYRQMPGIYVSPHPCGSGLARDDGVSVNVDFECESLIAGKPAPTGSSVIGWLIRAGYAVRFCCIRVVTLQAVLSLLRRSPGQ